MARASKVFISELRKQKRKQESGAPLLFLDNPKIIIEAQKEGVTIKYILKTEKANFSLDEEVPVYIVDQNALDSLSDVKTPQGVIGVAEYTPYIVEKPKGDFLVLDGVQDAGNVGTLLRSAYGAGFNSIYLIDCAGLTNMKVIRSSGGACFKLRAMEISRKDFTEFAKKEKLVLAKADMHGENVFSYKLKPPQLGVVIGNEGNGVSKEISELCTVTLSIPMQKGLESLNAGVSGSILMYVIANRK